MSSAKLIYMQIGRAAKYDGNTTPVRRARMVIEVEIDYPEDMPERVARDYCALPARWIVKYAASQAKREEDDHR